MKKFNIRSFSCALTIAVFASQSLFGNDAIIEDVVVFSEKGRAREQIEAILLKSDADYQTLRIASRHEIFVFVREPHIDNMRLSIARNVDIERFPYTLVVKGDNNQNILITEKEELVDFLSKNAEQGAAANP